MDKKDQAISESQYPLRGSVQHDESAVNIVSPGATVPTVTSIAASKPSRFLIYSQEQAYRHMMTERSEQEQELYIAVDEVLFNVWDALCVSVDLEFREQYLPYLPHVYDLLIQTSDGLDLYDYLVFVEEHKLGNSKPDSLARQRAARVVEILLDYRDRVLVSENNQE